jgi:hypothetical protein
MPALTPSPAAAAPALLFSPAPECVAASGARAVVPLTPDEPALFTEAMQRILRRLTPELTTGERTASA